MEASCGDPHPPAKSARDQFIDGFLRSWLCTKSSMTVDEVKTSLEFLGRPARDTILKAGGLEAFVRSSPDLAFRNGRLVAVPTPVPFQPSKEQLLIQMDRFTPTELTILNEQLRNVRLEPKSGEVVSALQKRGQIEELRGKCREKRAVLDRRKQAEELMNSERSAAAMDSEQKRIEELIQRRDELRRRVTEGGKILAKERKLQKEMGKVDTRIEETEDQVKRLQLKAMMIQESLVTLRQDLFFESKQHEATVEQLLTQHSADTERAGLIVRKIAAEKFAHTNDVLELHIARVAALLQAEGSAPEEDGEVNRSRLLLSEYQDKLKELKEIENHFRQWQRVDLARVVQLPVPRIRDLEWHPRGCDGGKRYSVIFPRLVEDVLREEVEPYDEEGTSGQGSMGLVENCLICLHDLNSEVSETLTCSHSFHSSCLREMRKHGHTSCPLCRCYEPSPTDFPSLPDTNP